MGVSGECAVPGVGVWAQGGGDNERRGQKMVPSDIKFIGFSLFGK